MTRIKLENRENIMKIISLIVAILLWSYVMSEVDPVITRTFYNLPVKFTNISSLAEKKLVLISPEAESIDVTVKGKRKLVNEMSDKDISASIDLSYITLGTKSMEINVRLSDSSIAIEGQNPTNITVEIDKIVEKEFDLELQTIGELPEGYLLDLVTKNEEEVLVKGPEALLNSIYTVVANVNIEGRTETILINAPIKAYDKDKKPIESVEINPKSSEVEVGISKTKSTPIEVTLEGDAPEDFLKERVEVTPGNVLLSGPSASIDKIDKITTNAISPTNLLELKTIPVSLNIPEGVKLVNPIENFIVRYNSEAKITKDLSLSTEKIVDEFGNELSKDKIKNPSEIKIKVKGEPGLISALNPKDFTLRITPRKFRENEKVKIKVEAPTGLELLSVEPEYIELTNGKE